MKQFALTDFDRDIEAKRKALEMSEEERIEFIRDNGTEEMKAGLESVFGSNKYKPVREKMWEERLHNGKKMVRKIIEIENGDEFG